MPVLTNLLSRLGLSLNGAKSNGEVPVYNREGPGGNKPDITVRYAGSGVYSSYGMPTAEWTSISYQGLAEKGYKRNSDVYACVSLIAQAAKSTKWWDGTDGTKAITDDDLLAKAVRTPTEINAYQMQGKARLDPKPSIRLLIKAGGPSYVESWVCHMLLSGNSFQEVIRNDRTISMLYLDNPGLITPEINRNALHPDGAVEKWRIRNPYGSGTWRFVEPFSMRRTDEAIVHSKLFNPTSDVIGMSPLESGMMRVDWQNEGATLAKRILQRGFAPGWIEAKDDTEWTDEQVAALKERIKLSKSAGEEMFLQGAAWHDMGFKLGDAGIADQQVLAKRDIAAIFHVDPALIGDTSSRTYATYAQSRLALYMEAVVPLLTQFRDDWNRTIGAELGSPLDFDKDAFDAITAARQEAADRVHKLWSAGVITQNEARHDLEYEPVAGGDVFYAPANFVPMGEAEPESE